jgi:hypothetical protein
MVQKRDNQLIRENLTVSTDGIASEVVSLTVVDGVRGA